MNEDPAAAAVSLPADDPALIRGPLDLDMLAQRWGRVASGSAISGDRMRGLDRRAQVLGVPGRLLMEQAGAAVAAAVRALLSEAERDPTGPALILAGPGNNGGDGAVAARYLASSGVRSVVVLVGRDARPRTEEAGAAWDRLDGLDLVERAHAPTPREVGLLAGDVGDAAIVVDALLGSGVQGRLREPVSSAVELVRSARAEGVPVLAVDTPTALDLGSGVPSDPVVRADVTVTFHRPKLGLLTPWGQVLAGRVLVAPIGIPPEADRS
jgi:ADP-dependent NAD(P)H-hydrate dehydratase / NAD(P)H-hydrate epimerase